MSSSLRSLSVTFFQMEIDILEINLEILAIWHAGVEFAKFPCELVEVF